MRTASTLLALLRPTSSSTRAGICTIAGSLLGARLLVVGTALAVGRAEAHSAVLLGVAAVMCLAVERFALVLTRGRIERDLQRAAIEALLEGDVLDVARERTQRVVIEGIYHSVPLLGSALPTLVGDLVAAGIVLPLVAGLFPGRVLASAALALVVVLAAVVVARRIAHRGEMQLASAYEDIAELLLFAVEGRLEIVAGGHERVFEQRFASQSDLYVARADRVGFVSAWLGRAPLVIGAVALGVVALIDVPSRADLSTALFTRTLILAACLPLVLGAVVGIHSVARATTLARPFVRMLADEPRGDVDGIGETVALPATFEGERLTFAYGKDQPPLFAGLSFVWRPGAPLLIVGPNGTGKSTLLKLLLGLRAPTSGVLRVDGRDLATIDRRALRRRMVYLPQRPYLGEAHTSVRAAMAFAAPEASDSAVIEALEAVDVLDAIRAHGGNPLDATVGTLSTGQRQRVALARLRLQDAEVFLLDEPDANLDREGIALIREYVTQLGSEGKMVAIAAHTPELAALSPEPVVLDKM